MSLLIVRNIYILAEILFILIMLLANNFYEICHQGSCGLKIIALKFTRDTIIRFHSWNVYIYLNCAIKM